MVLMRAEIISVGTELLVGSILNTNTQFLSQELLKCGVDVYYQTTVGDNPGRVIDTLKIAMDRSDFIILSGGLGPTEDDVTVESFARFIQKPLVFHAPTHRAILRRLKLRDLRMTRLIAKQCRVPQGSLVLENENGTAPGILYKAGGSGAAKWFLLLPGPPRELGPMFKKRAMPLFFRVSGIKKKRLLLRSVKITGLVEAQVAQKATDLLRMKPPLTVGIYARPEEVELKIMAKAINEKNAAKMTQKVEKIIRGRFGNKVFGVNEETLAESLGHLLRKKKKTLAAAESCTGGLLSHLITETPGSSDYFRGSVVAYDNRIKSGFLDVPQALLKKEGAVSAAVAQRMAQNIRSFFKADYGIGITGIAGPSGGSPQKPVGLVHIALATPSKTFSEKWRFQGSRSEIKHRAAHHALNLLRLALLQRVN
jgi:nicotinamide-nucleotide amidase